MCVVRRSAAVSLRLPNGGSWRRGLRGLGFDARIGTVPANIVVDDTRSLPGLRRFGDRPAGSLRREDEDNDRGTRVAADDVRVGKLERRNVMGGKACERWRAARCRWSLPAPIAGSGCRWQLPVADRGRACPSPGPGRTIHEYDGGVFQPEHPALTSSLVRRFPALSGSRYDPSPPLVR